MYFIYRDLRFVAMYSITYWLWYQPLSLFPLKIVSHLGELEQRMLGRRKRFYDAFGWVQYGSHPIWGMDRCTRFGSLCHGEGFKISGWSHGRWTPTPRECASDDIYIYIYCIYNIGMGQDLECHVGWTAIYQIFRRHGVPGFWPKNHIQVFCNYSIQFFTNASAHILLSPRQTQTLPTLSMTLAARILGGMGVYESYQARLSRDVSIFRRTIYSQP